MFHRLFVGFSIVPGIAVRSRRPSLRPSMKDMRLRRILRKHHCGRYGLRFSKSRPMDAGRSLQWQNRPKTYRKTTETLIEKRRKSRHQKRSNFNEKTIRKSMRKRLRMQTSRKTCYKRPPARLGRVPGGSRGVSGAFWTARGPPRSVPGGSWGVSGASRKFPPSYPNWPRSPPRLPGAIFSRFSAVFGFGRDGFLKKF